MRNRKRAKRDRARAALFLGSGIACAALVAITLSGWLYAGSASAATTTETTEIGVIVADETTYEADETTDDTLHPGGLIPPSGPTVPTVPEDPSAPRQYVDDNGCLSCHGDPSLASLMTKTRPDGSTIALHVDPNALAFSVHRFNDCTTCHTSDPHESPSPLTKLSLAEKCGSCHQFEYNQYIESVHGMPQLDGNSDPATCVDCHSTTSNPHNIERVLDPSATTYPKNIAETCAKCHDNEELMGKYGIVEKVYDSYLRSFHGKAIDLSGDDPALQQLNTATCVNCHGAHNISMVSNPDSPVAGMENLAKTCEQCHPNAGVEFAKGFLGHKEADTDNIPQVFWGERFFTVFTRVVLIGGVTLVVGPFFRRGVVDRIKRRKRPPEQGQGQEKEEDQDHGQE